MKSQFPKPWRVLWVGEAYRVFDANSRHLFIISSDEFLNGDEDPGEATVLMYGSDEENEALDLDIERMIEGFRDI